MKILNVYKSEPDETVKKLVEIVTRVRESDTFHLSTENHDYDLYLSDELEKRLGLCKYEFDEDYELVKI